MTRYFYTLLVSLFLFAGTMISKAEETTYRGPVFAWGAELGSNIDMTSHNMSSIGINAKFGFQWKWIRFIGVGAEGNIMVSNSSRSYPLFATFRTDFSNRNRLFFMDLRGGVALNYLYDHSYNGVYLSPGVGITLAKGRNFSSHVMLAYTYIGQDRCLNGLTTRKCTGISYATLRLGITFGNNPKGGTLDATKTNKRLKSNSLSNTKSSQMSFADGADDSPDFIDYSSNRIIFPENVSAQQMKRWQALARDLDNAVYDGNVIDVMHIGDSHIQAEMGTTRLREILQHRYGNAGRGLITAFRLAGTNQPVDYAITSSLPVDSQVRLLKRPWPIKPGFTGVASLTNRSNLITFKNLKGEHKFKHARIYTSDGERRLHYPNLMDSAQFYVLPGEKVYGVYTDNGNPGLVYSTIGNNGACFSDYLLLDSFAEDVARFKPRLIVLSMGTNEGYSSMTDDEIASTTRWLIERLRTANPEALFLLWTPMECEKKDADDVFHINTRVRDARDIIIEVAQSEGIPYWDFYDVSGGDNAAAKWVDAGLMNPKDHVHLLGKGYRLQGELAARAFTDMIDALK